MSNELKELMQISVIGENKDLSNMIEDIMPVKEQRFTDLGFISGTKITPILTSPSGNIRAYNIKDTILAIRDTDSVNIFLN